MKTWLTFLALTVLLFCGCADVKEDMCLFRTYDANASVEQLIDGELAAKGDGMYVNTSSEQLYVYTMRNDTWGWVIPIMFDRENACLFGKIAWKKFYGPDDSRNRHVDMFINRPANSTILISKPLYMRLYYASGNTLAGAEAILWEDSALYFLEKRAKMPVIVYTGDPGVILMNLSRYREMGYTNVLITEDISDIPPEAQALIAESGMRSVRTNISGKDLASWLKEITGLATSATINLDTRGECIYAAQITGYAKSDHEAEEDMKDIACALPHSAADKERIYPWNT
jgi:hypothetical protein